MTDYTIEQAGEMLTEFSDLKDFLEQQADHLFVALNGGSRQWVTFDEYYPGTGVVRFTYTWYGDHESVEYRLNDLLNLTPETIEYLKAERKEAKRLETERLVQAERARIEAQERAEYERLAAIYG